MNPARTGPGLRGVGLLGQVVAILLLTVLIEFGASTLLYERASQFSVQGDEARRLAEHLVISRKLVAESPATQRPRMAAELTTDRYAVRWRRALPPPPPIAPALDAMRRQVIQWEPALATADLRLRLVSPGRSSVVTGGLRLDDGTWLYFRTLEPVTGLDLAAERVALALVPAIALMVLGAISIRRLLLPLRRLATAAELVGTGSEAAVARDVPEDGPGEVRRVVSAFNRMQGRIARLIADRTEALAAVGHDLRTPLARLKLRSEGVAEAEVRDAIARDVEEMDAMVASLLAFLGGDGDGEGPQRTDLAVLCQTLVDDCTDRGLDARYEGPDHHETALRVSAVRRALSNLLENAAHHADRFTLSLIPGSDGLVLRVDDNGPGIPDDKLVAVLEPFVRLDPARGRDTVGFGLGLPIVRQAAAAEGGMLALTNRPQGGLRAELHLPQRNNSLQARPVAATARS